MIIGGGQIRGALFNFFVVKKYFFLYLPDAALSFKITPGWNISRDYLGIAVFLAK